MAADASPTQAFKDGRASLRETAKWLVSGIATATALIGGSAIFSQLGSRPLWDPRALFAIACVLAAAFFWWKPFKAAVQVLKSETLGLRDFIAATAKTEPNRSPVEQEHALALAAADAKLLGYLPFGSITGLARECDRLRGVVFADRKPEPAAATTAARSDLDGLAPLEVFALETCSASLVVERFDTLVDALWRFGGMSLILFALFAWAANPPKNESKLLDKPIDVTRVLALDAEGLKAAGVDPACAAPGAALIAVSGDDHGAKTAILVPPHPLAKGCQARIVTLSPDYRIVKAD